MADGILIPVGLNGDEDLSRTDVVASCV